MACAVNKYWEEDDLKRGVGGMGAATKQIRLKLASSARQLQDDVGAAIKWTRPVGRAPHLLRMENIGKLGFSVPKPRTIRKHAQQT